MRRLGALLLSLAILAGCSARPAPGPARGGEGSAGAVDKAGGPGGDSAHVPAPVAPEPSPHVRVLLQPERVLQGDFVTLRLDRPVTGEVKVTVKGLEEQSKVFLKDGAAVAFIGFPAAARVGTYPVSVTWEKGRWDGQLEVVRKQFTEDRLVVTEEQQAIYYDPRQEQEWKRVFDSRSRTLPEPLWRDAFRLPLAGPIKITTYFGEIRFVNGVETGRHSGMDFAAETGTPILAPARGKVVLAEKLIVTGWTIIIDHGVNLYTVYYHCNTVTVKTGEMVRPGEQIGTVGSTGFSTGPHLHWTATIGNTPVDPWALTKAPVLGLFPVTEVLPIRPR